MSTHKERSRMDAKYIMLLSPTDNTRRLIQKASKTREKPTRTYSRLDGTHQLYTNAMQHIPIFPSPTLFISTHTRRTRNDTVIFVVSINDDDRKRKQKGRAPRTRRVAGCPCLGSLDAPAMPLWAESTKTTRVFSTGERAADDFRYIYIYAAMCVHTYNTRCMNIE